MQERPQPLQTQVEEEASHGQEEVVELLESAAAVLQQPLGTPATAAKKSSVEGGSQTHLEQMTLPSSSAVSRPQPLSRKAARMKLRPPARASATAVAQELMGPSHPPQLPSHPLSRGVAEA